ncbi:MAG: hypothetical protein LBQ50_12910 [Planctomycetaceae bacterium]|jgi:hypothetical protein|nr:hypothetical protein [Planctomycetaceae bacterium]
MKFITGYDKDARLILCVFARKHEKQNRQLLPDMLAKYRQKKKGWNDYFHKANEKRRIKTIKLLRQNWQMVTRWWEHSFEIPDGYQFVQKYTGLIDAFGSPSKRHNYLGESTLGGWFGGMGVGMGGMGGGFSGGENEQNDSITTATSGVVLTPRVSDSPYLAVIRNAAEQSVQSAYSVYLEQRKQYQRVPFFYWESALLFHEFGDTETALRILSNLQELDLGDDPITLRMIGFLMLQWNLIDHAVLRFQEALELDKSDLVARRGLALTFLLHKNPDQNHFVQSLKFFRELIENSWKFNSYYFDADFHLIVFYELCRQRRGENYLVSERQATIRTPSKCWMLIFGLL